MPLRPDPSLAAAVLARLEALGDLTAESEDDVLACLVVTGEPRPQRVLDDWLDQVADTLRALGEGSADLASGMAADAVPRAERSAGGTVVGLGSGAADAVPRVDAPAGGSGDLPLELGDGR